MVSDRVYELCHEVRTVSSEMAKNPTAAPGNVYRSLYNHLEGDKSTEDERDHKKEISKPDLKRAEECGQWGPTRPSVLFLQVCGCTESSNALNCYSPSDVP